MPTNEEYETRLLLDKKMLDDYRNKMFAVNVEKFTFDLFDKALEEFLKKIDDKNDKFYADDKKDANDYNETYKRYESQRWMHVRGLCTCSECQCDVLRDDLLNDMKEKKSKIGKMKIGRFERNTESWAIDGLKFTVSNTLGNQKKSPTILGYINTTTLN